MRRLRYGMFFISGVAATLAVVLVLALFGVVPVRSRTTTVVRQQVAGLPTTMTGPAAGVVAGSLTPSEIYRKYAAGVVEVVSTFDTSGVSGFFGSATSEALGSGFVAASDGSILTNAHVVSNNGQAATKVVVVFKGTGTNAATTRVPATILGVDDRRTARSSPTASRPTRPSTRGTPVAR